MDTSGGLVWKFFASSASIFLRRCPAQQLVQILRDGPVRKRGDQNVADLNAVSARRLFNDVLSVSADAAAQGKKKQ